MNKMLNMTLEKGIQRGFGFLKRHGSEVLAVLSVVGVFATAASAANAAPKAAKILEAEEQKKGEELTTLEKVKAVGPTYIPTVLLGAGTSICILGIHTVNKRQQAALTAAYGLLDESFKRYKGKVKEICGEEVEESIREAIALEDRPTDKEFYQPHVPGEELLPLDEGEKYLFYDEYKHGYFEATMEDVLNAEYHLNRNFTLRGSASINEFYTFMGLAPTDFGDAIGWGCGRLLEEYEFPWIDISIRRVEMDDGLECYFIEYPIPPSATFEEW